MIPIHLKIAGFLSYYEPVELDFTTFDLACISGANGSGKSSLLDAITWALFGVARRRDDTILNNRANNAEVVFDFEYESCVYRISRNKPREKSTILELLIQGVGGGWKPLTEHSVKDTENRIQQILHLDYETFTNASFFLQGKADQFSQQKPGDRKRILSSILGLDAWEQYREKASAKRRLVENELSVLDGQLNEIESELGQEDDRIALLNKLQQELEKIVSMRQEKEKILAQVRLFTASLEEQKKLVGSLSDRLEVNRSRFQEREQKLRDRTYERQQYQDQLSKSAEITTMYQRWQEDIRELEHIEDIATNFRQYDTQRSAPLIVIEKDKARLEEELRGLKDQQHQVDEWQSQLIIFEKQFAIAQAELKNTLTTLTQNAGLDIELQSAIESISEKTAENTQLCLLMDELKKRIKELQKTSGAECPLCGQPLSQAEREQLLDSLNGQGKEMGDRHRSNVEEKRLGEQKKEELKTRITGFEKMRTLQVQQQRTVDQLSERVKQTTQSSASWRDGGEKRLVEISGLLQDGNYAVEARQELAKINAALSDLGYDAAAHDQLRRQENEGRASEAKVRSLENARAALIPLEREIEDLQKGLDEDLVEIQAAEAIYQQAENKLENDIKNIPDLKNTETELYAVLEEENRLRNNIGGARQAVEVIKTQRLRKKDLGEKREEVNRKISRIKVLERAFSKDGVPALLIEQALPEIEARANQILDQLTSGGMSVRFSTQKDYKDKNREDKKETLEIMISDAAGMREYELFSGGEAFRVNFAIRLALSRYLSQRAGARLQTLVIDEGFGSQDADGRQRLLQAINLVQHDFRKVLIITHLEELKDAFPVRIEVNKMPNGSSIRVVA